MGDIIPHVFLDTTTAFNDPYLNNSKYSGIMNQLAIENKIEIHVSAVMVAELVNQLEQRYSLLESNLKEIHKYQDTEDLKNQINQQKTNEAKRLREFYQKSKIFRMIQIPSKASAYDVILNKSLKGIKPFNSEKKDSFRDALIWESYKEYCFENNITKCAFISKNISDFSAAIHHEWTGMVHFPDFHKFISRMMSEEEIKTYGDSLNYQENPERVFKLVTETFMSDLIEETKDFVKQLSPQKILHEYAHGEVYPNRDISVESIELQTKFAFKGELYIPFRILAYQEVTMTLFDSEYYDEYTESKSSEVMLTLQIDALLQFRNGNYSNFDITGFSILNYHEL